jgi:cob(I)alamin adenosyltransferase
MPISTKRGDKGQTSLPGGIRISKGEMRVEASGSVDELKACMGLARSFCEDPEVNALTKAFQRELFAIGSAISTKPGGRRPIPEITDEMVKRLDEHSTRIEGTPGLLRDWTLSGDLRSSAAYDVARAVCRRAERNVVRLVTAGETIQPNVLAYLNRLSDILWLFSRLLDLRAGVDARLRDEAHPGPPWSRAW